MGIKNNLPTFIFFFILFVSLFLGEAKQGLVEIYFAGAVPLLALLFLRQKSSIHSLPMPVNIAWILLISYFSVTTWFSASVGYSISATMRIFMAYVVFYVFYSAKDIKISVFINSLIVFVLIADAFSYVFIFTSYLRNILPPTNLLSASYGHHHIVQLLLFVIPLLLNRFLSRPTIVTFFTLLFVLVTFTLASARGAYMILGLYLIYFTFGLSRKKSIKQALLTLLGSIFLLSMIILLPLGNGSSLISKLDIFGRLPLKSQLGSVRLEYWRQGLEAFKSHPLFGYGPGTFNLISKRYQSKPDAYSLYAHSFFFEQLSETGLVGIALWSILLFLIFKKLFRYLQLITHNSQLITQNSPFDSSFRSSLRAGNSQLLVGILLVFLYSFLDFTFNFLTVWLLWWACIGVLVREIKAKEELKSTLPKRLIVVSIIILFLYYGVYAGSFLLNESKNLQTQKLAWQITPFDIPHTIQLLERTTAINQNLEDNILDQISFFHKRDAEIISELTKISIAKNNSAKARINMQKQIELDPRNSELHKKYLIFIASTFPTEFGEAFLSSSLLALPKKLHQQVTALIVKKINPNNFRILLESSASDSLEVYYAKLYYLIGLNALSNDPKFTLEVWIIARDIYPNMGLLHHELIALVLYKFKDTNLARQYLQKCLEIPYASLHCKNIDSNFNNLPLPGTVQENILNIHL